MSLKIITFFPIVAALFLVIPIKRTGVSRVPVINFLLAISVFLILFIYAIRGNNIESYLLFFSFVYLLLSITILFDTGSIENGIYVFMLIYLVAMIIFQTNEVHVISGGIIVTSFLMLIAVARYRNKRECIYIASYNLIADGLLFAFLVLKHSGASPYSVDLALLLAYILKVIPVPYLFMLKSKARQNFVLDIFYYPICGILFNSFLFARYYSSGVPDFLMGVVFLVVLAITLPVAVYSLLSDDLRDSTVAFSVTIAVISFFTIATGGKGIDPAKIIISTSCIAALIYLLRGDLYRYSKSLKISEIKSAGGEISFNYILFTALLILCSGFWGATLFLQRMGFLDDIWKSGGVEITIANVIFYSILNIILIAAAVRLWASIFAPAVQNKWNLKIDKKYFMGSPWTFAFSGSVCFILIVTLNVFFLTESGELLRTYKAIGIGVAIPFLMAFFIYIFAFTAVGASGEKHILLNMFSVFNEVRIVEICIDKVDRALPGADKFLSMLRKFAGDLYTNFIARRIKLICYWISFKNDIVVFISLVISLGLIFWIVLF